MPKPLLLLGLLAGVALLGCDTGITGTPNENTPPETELSVREISLVENLGDERLSSTVDISWVGNDPDGFVAAYELRYYFENETPGAEAGWALTTARDSLILLPIPKGESAANVVFEVRAIDNEGALDPTPARTVFPIKNAPPTLRLSPFDLPPDTTFTIVSFAVDADDPEGAANLAGIEISLNDSTSFVRLPADTEFITLVGQADRDDAGQTQAEAQVYLGRSFQRTALTVPGMQFNATNTLYVRAVDQTDTTSTRVDFEWYVKKPSTPVLVVNDYRTSANVTVLNYHLNLLEEYLGYRPDVWDISTPFTTGSSGFSARSPLLGPNQEPTLQQTLALYDYIYWVTKSSTDSPTGNNLPYAAPTFDVFFDQGGKLMVQSPVTLPPSGNLEDNLDNPALFLLPIGELVPVPDSLRSRIIERGADVTPVGTVPGLGVELPALEATQFIITANPYKAGDALTIPLYEAEFTYQTRQGRRFGTWPGPSVVASIGLDPATQTPRVGLFGLPMVNEQSGVDLFAAPDGDDTAAERAVKLMLESLGFPKQ